MNVHDGIPFIRIGAVGDSWIFNPMHIVKIFDLDDEQCSTRKVRKPSCVIYTINGSEGGHCVVGSTAQDIVDKINKTMTSWKDKLADKALLGE
jgi:hypothetical protein